MFTQVVVALILTFSRCTFAAAACSRKYTVKEGDICDKISQIFHVSSHQLAATNPGVINEDCSNLEAGESICLGFVNENCPTTHTVKAGDTCLKIANENGLSMKVLRTNNPQLNQSCDIYDGEVLCISKTVIQGPPIASEGPVTTSELTFPPTSSSQPPPTASSTSFTAGVTTISFPSNLNGQSINNNVIGHSTSRSLSSPTPTSTKGGNPDESNLPDCDNTDDFEDFDDSDEL